MTVLPVHAKMSAFMIAACGAHSSADSAARCTIVPTTRQRSFPCSGVVVWVVVAVVVKDDVALVVALLVAVVVPVDVRVVVVVSVVVGVVVWLVAGLVDVVAEDVGEDVMEVVAVCVPVVVGVVVVGVVVWLVVLVVVALVVWDVVDVVVAVVDTVMVWLVVTDVVLVVVRVLVGVEVGEVVGVLRWHVWKVPSRKESRALLRCETSAAQLLPVTCKKPKLTHSTALPRPLNDLNNVEIDFSALASQLLASTSSDRPLNAVQATRAVVLSSTQSQAGPPVMATQAALSGDPAAHVASCFGLQKLSVPTLPLHGLLLSAVVPP